MLAVGEGSQEKKLKIGRLSLQTYTSHDSGFSLVKNTPMTIGLSVERQGLDSRELPNQVHDLGSRGLRNYVSYCVSRKRVEDKRAGAY